MYKMYTHDGPGSHWPGPKGRAPIMCVILYILHNVYIISKLFSIYFLIYLTPIRRDTQTL